MTSFTRFRSLVTKSYVASSSKPSETEIGLSDEVDALRWKLIGKNEAFRIIHEAATTIQAFWRGCFSRTRTSAKIESLIEELVTFQKLEAEYKRKDQELQKRQNANYCDPEHDHNVSGDEQKSILNGDMELVLKKNKNKPWRTISEGENSCNILTILPISSANSSRTMDWEEVEGNENEERPSTTNHATNRLESEDDGCRGYRRYRTNIHGKNRTRPWRDDTSVFDAY